MVLEIFVDDLDVPNCPAHLVQMEAVELNDVVVWRCPECELVKL